MTKLVPLPTIYLILGAAVALIIVNIYFIYYFTRTLNNSLLNFPYRHIFIYRTFVYQNSTSFGTNNYDTVVTLFVAEASEHFPYLRCHRQDTVGRKLSVPAVITKLDFVGICKYVTFVTWCTFPQDLQKGLSAPASSHTKRKLASQYSFEFGTQKSFHNKGSISPWKHKLNPTFLPNERYKSRFSNDGKKSFNKAKSKMDLVVCISRIFAFEQWQILITAIEVYKALRVDLIVTHIYSVLTPIYWLMKAYEADGRLLIRHGVRLPKTPDMIEYSGQLLLAHECFYEFHERSKFIVLVDWDDLLVSLNHETLPAALNIALQKFPKASFFYINKLDSALNLSTNSLNPRHFAASKFFGGIRTKPVFNSEKLVLMPERIRGGFWIHFVRDYSRKKWKQGGVKLHTRDLLILHLAKTMHENSTNGFTMNLIKNSTKEIIRANFNQFIRKRNSQNMKILETLPQRTIYLDYIRHCSKFINAYPILHWPSPCLSYSLCQFKNEMFNRNLSKLELEKISWFSVMYVPYRFFHYFFILLITAYMHFTISLSETAHYNVNHQSGPIGPEMRVKRQQVPQIPPIPRIPIPWPYPGVQGDVN